LLVLSLGVLHRWEPLRRARRLRIILRINGVLFLCTGCFILRVIMLAIRFFQAEIHKDDERVSQSVSRTPMDGWMDGWMGGMYTTVRTT
jgi:hypothetical protein